LHLQSLTADTFMYEGYYIHGILTACFEDNYTFFLKLKTISVNTKEHFGVCLIIDRLIDKISPL
jgi:hypothetical protein